MRRAALALLLSSCLPSAAAAQIVPPQNSKPEPTPKVDTIPAARDVSLSRNDAADGRCDATSRAAIFRVHQHVPVTGGRRFRPALSEMGSGRPQPAQRHQEGHGLPGDAPTGSSSKWMRDKLDVYAFHVDVPEGVTRGRRRLPICHADRRQPGPHRRDARHGEHPVAVELDVSGRLLRPADPGPGVGHRPRRAGRSPPRSGRAARPATGSTIR